MIKMKKLKKKLKKKLISLFGIRSIKEIEKRVVFVKRSLGHTDFEGTVDTEFDFWLEKQPHLLKNLKSRDLKLMRMSFNIFKEYLIDDFTIHQSMNWVNVCGLKKFDGDQLKDLFTASLNNGFKLDSQQIQNITDKTKTQGTKND